MTHASSAEDLVAAIRACRICADRFAATATGHAPRPVVWFGPAPRLLIAGQAPGARVHASGRPFSDVSGDRLRDWCGMTEAEFYDQTRVAIVPMAFCFPGYDAKGADLPPPPICARTWRARAMAALPEVRLTLAIGGAAQGWHLGKGSVATRVADRVADWRSHAERGIWPLPHPSWRNTGWLRRNPWFEAEVIPALRLRIRSLLEERP
jgi:uracil-DNA glycosylase